MMVVINFRKAFFPFLLVFSAAVLLMGYAGWSRTLISQAPASSAVSPDSKPPIAPKNPSKTTVANFMPKTSQVDKENFFVDYRLEREKSRGRQVEILKEIVDNPSSAADTRKAAQEQMMEISSSMAKEVKVENILKAKGYKDAVACVDKKGVTVVVDSPSISQAEEASIINMVSKETGYGEQGIIIVPKKN